MDAEFLAPFPRILHDGGLAHVQDLFYHVQFAQAVAALAARQHVAQVAFVLLAHVLHVAQPVVDQADARARHGRMHALAAVMADDDDMFDFQHVHGKLQDGQAIEVGMHDHVGNIAVHKHVARRHAQQFVGGHAAVGAADPQVFGRRLRFQVLEEVRVFRHHRVGPAAVTLQQFRQGHAIFRFGHIAPIV